MASAQAVSVTPPVACTTASSQQKTRRLQWSYRRDGEMLTCALALTSDHAAYELRVSPPRYPYGPPSELFDDAIAAFQRQATLERALLAEGWSLEGFEHS